VWFVLITANKLDVVAYTTVDIAVERNTFFPITLTVFVATVLIVLGDLQQSRIKTSISILRKRLDCGYKRASIAGTNILVDTVENFIINHIGYHTEREQVTPAFALVDVSHCPGIKLSAVAAVL
jgi:hypothetical protein